MGKDRGQGVLACGGSLRALAHSGYGTGPDPHPIFFGFRLPLYEVPFREKCVRRRQITSSARGSAARVIAMPPSRWLVAALVAVVLVFVPAVDGAAPSEGGVADLAGL